MNTDIERANYEKAGRAFDETVELLPDIER